MELAGKILLDVRNPDIGIIERIEHRIFVATTPSQVVEDSDDGEQGDEEGDDQHQPAPWSPPTLSRWFGQHTQPSEEHIGGGPALVLVGVAVRVPAGDEGRGGQSRVHARRPPTGGRIKVDDGIFGGGLEPGLGGRVAAQASAPPNRPALLMATTVQ